MNFFLWKFKIFKTKTQLINNQYLLNFFISLKVQGQKFKWFSKDKLLYFSKFKAPWRSWTFWGGGIAILFLVFLGGQVFFIRLSSGFHTVLCVFQAVFKRFSCGFIRFFWENVYENLIEIRGKVRFFVENEKSNHIFQTL